MRDRDAKAMATLEKLESLMDEMAEEQEYGEEVERENLIAALQRACSHGSGAHIQSLSALANLLSRDEVSTQEAMDYIEEQGLYNEVAVAQTDEVKKAIEGQIIKEAKKKVKDDVEKKVQKEIEEKLVNEVNSKVIKKPSTPVPQPDPKQKPLSSLLQLLLSSLANNVEEQGYYTE